MPFLIQVNVYVRREKSEWRMVNLNVSSGCLWVKGLWVILMSFVFVVSLHFIKFWFLF